MSSAYIGENSRLFDSLLASPEATGQLALLQEAGRANEEGLLSLLEETATMIRDNPGRAQRLLTIYAAAANQAGVAAVLPRAYYLQAQTHALAGEFDKALALINAARDGYMALGQEVSAMRTTAGLMHVLGESGRYQEALAAGRAVLDKIGQTDQPSLVGILAHIQQNIGLCCTYLGQYDEAVQAYNAAEACYLELDMAAQAGDISNNRGILLWEMGRGTEALPALEKALAIRIETKQTMLQAQTLSNIGSVHLLLGHYTASLESFEYARRLFKSLGVLVDQHVLLLDTANAYLTLNLFNEALSAYREAAELLLAAGVVHQHARAQWGMGATYLALKQPVEAEEALDRAVIRLESISETPTPLLATILLEQAAAQSALGQVPAARTTAWRALDLVKGNDWPIPAIYAHLQLADLEQEDFNQVELHLAAARQLIEPLGLPQFKYRWQQRLGRLLRQQGRYEEARGMFEEAISGVERLRGMLPQESLRTSFIQDKTIAYDELLQCHLLREDSEGDQLAFGVAERAKSRTLLDLITGAIDVPAAGDDTAAAQRQALQADLNAIYNELLGMGATGMAPGRYQILQARAIELETAITQHQLRQTGSDDAGEQWAAPLSPERIREELPEEITLLAYHIIEDEILAFVVTRHDLRVFRDLGRESAVQALLRRLEGMLDRLRAGEVFSAAQISRLELSTRRILELLYQTLIGPLAACLGEQHRPDSAGNPQKLSIIPHGCLHQVPFHALADDQGYLIDRYELAYAPSATIYQLCQSRPPLHWQKELIVGVSDALIPAVKAEVETVAAHLPQAQVLLDEQATQANFQAHVENCHLLHMACHGLFRADNPMFSSLKLYDGWLTAGDAMNIKLSNALVTLSACESGRSRVAGGDELLGLLRAFLGAGASAIIVSLWLVQDAATARLMAHWYDQLQHRPVEPARALRAALLALKEEYPHPYYWAPFIAIGRR